MNSDTYDSDDDNRSDRLKPATINYQPEDDELPPFYQRPSSPKSDDAKGAAEKETSGERFRKRLPTQKPETSLGDEVLIRYLDPNSDYIARFERLEPLSSRVPPEGEPGQSVKLKRPEPEPQGNSVSSSHSNICEKAKSALNYLTEELYQEDKERIPPHDPKAEKSIKPQNKAEDKAVRPETTSPNRHQILPGISTSPDSISHLKKYNIPVPERLPAIQSPPQSVAASSPENRQNLPSIQSAIGDLPAVPPKDPSGRVNGASPYAFPPISTSSPSAPRNELAGEPLLGQFQPPQIPLSPYSHLSPASSKDMSNMPSPASQQPYLRPLKPDIPYVASNYEVLPQTTQSPATSYPTPTEQSASERASFSSNSQPNGAVSTGLFKCRHPGCSAAFQTQYLLK